MEEEGQFIRQSTTTMKRAELSIPPAESLSIQSKNDYETRFPSQPPPPPPPPPPSSRLRRPSRQGFALEISLDKRLSRRRPRVILLRGSSTSPAPSPVCRLLSFFTSISMTLTSMDSIGKCRVDENEIETKDGSLDGNQSKWPEGIVGKKLGAGDWSRGWVVGRRPIGCSPLVPANRRRHRKQVFLYSRQQRFNEEEMRQICTKIGNPNLVKLGNRVLWSFNKRVTRFGSVLLGLIGFDWVVMGFIGLNHVLIEKYVHDQHWKE